MRTRREEWAERVRRWRRSGLTAKEFARSVGINSGTLTYWACRLGHERRARDGGSLRSGVWWPAPAAGFVELIAGSGSDPRFELELGNGRRVRIPGSFEPAALQRLLGVLEAGR
jgi:transposase